MLTYLGELWSGYYLSSSTWYLADKAGLQPPMHLLQSNTSGDASLGKIALSKALSTS